MSATDAWVASPGPFHPGQDVASRTRHFQALEGAPLAEVVRWLSPLSERVMLNKDGAMLAAIAFEGLDLDSTGVEKMNAVRSQLLYALQQLGRETPVLGWHVRRRVSKAFPSGEHPEPVSRRMNALLHEQFLRDEHYTNQHVITFSTSPRSRSSRILGAIRREQERGAGLGGWLSAMAGASLEVLRGEADFPYKDIESIEADHDHFEKLLDTFVAAVAALDVRVLTGQELGGFLRRTTSPCSGLTEPCALPPPAMFADEALPVGTVDNGHDNVLVFEHNDRRVYASCYTLDLRLAESAQLDLLDKLMGAPFEFTLTHTFKTLHRRVAKRAVGLVEAYHANRKYSLKSLALAAAGSGNLSGSPVKEGRERAAAEAAAIKDAVEEGELALGDWYGVVMVQASSLDELAVARKSAEEILQACRLNPRLEGMHKFSSYCSTIPGSHEEVARWSKIDQENFVDLCPARTVSAGHLVNHALSEKTGQRHEALVSFSTRSRTPFHYTGYVGELGHELVIGPSRTGKTALSTVLWSQFRKYPGARVVIFDKDYSCRPAVYLQGGHYIDLSPEKKTGQRLSPVAALLKDGSLQHLVFLAGWIEMLARIRGHSPTADDRRQLEAALRATAVAGLTSPSLLRLGSVVARLDATSAFARALQMWVGDSAYGHFFDNEVDHFDLQSLVGVEMGGILNDQELAGPAMSYAFYRVSSQLRQLGADDKPVPTLIYVPETWFFLRQPDFAAQLENWLVTLAKLGARVCFDTQTPDKLVQSPAFPAFRDNVPCLIFTPNERARTKSLHEMYVREWGLTEDELEFIANGIPKQDYYLRQGPVSRRIRFAMPPEVVAMVRSDQRAQILLERFIQEGLPPNWQRDYLNELMT